MTTRWVTQVKIERQPVSETETALFATIRRFGQIEHTYQISDASNQRARKVVYCGKQGYCSCWPLGGGRPGWYANMAEPKNI